MIETLLTLFRHIGIAKMIMLVGGFIVISIIAVMITVKYSEPEYIILYSNLEIEDTNKITADLEQKNISYVLRMNGTQILVPEDKVLKIRMALAAEGIPGKGSIVGYEIFDNQDAINTSNFVQNIHLLRALEGELGRTIASFQNIKKARVHLVIPKRELFSREYQAPSASVVVETKGAYSPNKEEVSAITHLVATAVAGLDPAKITIVDTKGKSLKISEENDGVFTGLSSNSQEYKITLEAKLKRTIEEILEKTVGPGGVEAQISAEINFDRIVTNSEKFDPDGQVVRSTQTIEEKESVKEKNSNTDASVGNNVPNSPTSEQFGENTNASLKSDETINYEISKTIQNHVSETGTIKKLSIAVLVDGVYTKDTQTGELKYSPRSQDELAKLEKIAKSAVGFSDERKDTIEIANMQFKVIEDIAHNETFVDWLKVRLENQIYGIVKSTLVGILLLVILLLFVKPFINRIFDSANEALKAQLDAEIAIAQAEVESINIKVQQEKEVKAVEMFSESDTLKLKKNNTFKSINDIAAQCPQETLMIIRNWLSTDASPY